MSLLPMRSLLRGALRSLGLEVRRHRPHVSHHERVVSLEPDGPRRGYALVSFILEPFLRAPGEPVSNDHTHDWESVAIVEALREAGFAVDVISFLNRSFVPERNYALFISARTNLERIARRLPPNCLTIAHLDTAHWLFNNTAAYQRLLAVQQRRGAVLNNGKMVEPNWALEHAHLGTVLGNQFTVSTYQYAGKPLVRIPISAPCTYPWDNAKDFTACRRNFLWFGSSGFVHKGLDLVLEAFAGMPEYRLTVCGPFDQEARFLRAYHKELYEAKNVVAVGWVDVAGPEFLKIARSSLGVVYPTCSEGGGGSVISCMHAGLIPVVSMEASVDVGNSGVILQESSIAEIRERVRELSERPVEQLQRMARESWELARSNHTREKFAKDFREFLNTHVLDRVPPEGHNNCPS